MLSESMELALQGRNFRLLSFVPDIRDTARRVKVAFTMTTFKLLSHATPITFGSVVLRGLVYMMPDLHFPKSSVATYIQHLPDQTPAANDKNRVVVK